MNEVLGGSEKQTSGEMLGGILNKYVTLEKQAGEIILMELKKLFRETGLVPAKLAEIFRDLEKRTPHALSEILLNKNEKDGKIKGNSQILRMSIENYFFVDLQTTFKQLCEGLTRQDTNFNGESIGECYRKNLGGGFFIEINGYNLDKNVKDNHVIKVKLCYEVETNPANKAEELANTLKG